MSRQCAYKKFEYDDITSRSVANRIVYLCVNYVPCITPSSKQYNCLTHPITAVQYKQ